MKITGYQQTVTNVGGSTSAPSLNLSASAKATANSAVDLSPVAKGLGNWAATIDKIHEQEDNENVMKAMDAYNKSRFAAMYNEENGFMNTKADGADGIADGYIEQEKKYRQEILGATKLHSRAKQVALDDLMNKSAQQGFQQVARHQYQQKEVALDLNLDNTVNTLIGFAQKNYNNGDMLDNIMQQAALMVDNRYSGVDNSSELREKAMRKYMGNVVAAAIDTAMYKEDYQTVQAYNDKYWDVLSPEQRRNIGKVTYTKAQNKWESDFVKAGYEKYGDNIDAFIKSLDGAQGFSMGNIQAQQEGTTWHRKDGVQLDGLTANAKNGINAVAQTFSSMFGEKMLITSAMDGQHSSHNGNMIDMTDDWESKLFSSKANRDKFISALEAQGIKVYNEYEKDSAYKTGDHLHLDFTNYKGGEGAPQAMSDEQKERIKKQYMNYYAEQKRIKGIQNDNEYNDFSHRIFEGKNNGSITYEQAIEMARQESGGDAQLFNRLVSATNSWFGGHNVGTGSKGSNAKGIGTAKHDISKEMLRNGHFDSQQEYVEFVAKMGGNEKDVWQANKDYNSFKKGEGEFKYDITGMINGAIKDAGGDKMGGMEKARLSMGLRSFVSQEISDYITKNKQQPTNNEVAEMIENAITKRTFVYQTPGKYFNAWESDTEVQLNGADLANMNISAIMPAYDGNGREMGNWYNVKMNDGRIIQMNAQRLEAMKNGNTRG